MNPPTTSRLRFRTRLHEWAESLKRDALTLWFAYRHPQAPWSAKLLGAFVIAYALSPIDLIPDFVPIFGYLDDVLLLPGLIWLALRLLPPAVLAESRTRAERWSAERRGRPRSMAGAVLVVVLWLACLWLTWLSGRWAWALLQR
jgi:uncharacterized membrane protein YkvA (DUF1232 family)